MVRMMTSLTLALTLVVSCSSSPPLNYYLLTADRPAGESGSVQTSVGLGPVTLPEYLRRSEIAYFTGNTLEISDTARWAEPLDSAVPRVLADNLSRRAPEAHVVIFPWRQDETPAYAIRVDILRLNRRQGSMAVLEAGWRLLDNDTKAVLEQGAFARTRSMDQFSHGALAGAYSELLAELSGILGEALARHAGGAGARAGR